MTLSDHGRSSSRWLIRLFVGAALLLVSFQGSASLAQVTNELPAQLEGVGVVERFGERIPGDIKLVDEQGQPVVLSELLKSGKPVLLNLTYFTCPMLCSMVLNGLVEGLRGVEYTPGHEFEMLSVSIDARDKPDVAAKKKANYVSSYGRPQAASGWHFLTGEEAEVRRLADAVGFQYRWDDAQQQFAHAAVTFVLTPEGKVARYLYGIQYASQDLRLALLEASEGRIGSPLERFMLFCYQYDPAGKKYALYARNIMRLGGGIMVFVLGGALVIYWRRERRREKQQTVPN